MTAFVGGKVENSLEIFLKNLEDDGFLVFFRKKIIFIVCKVALVFAVTCLLS